MVKGWARSQVRGFCYRARARCLYRTRNRYLITPPSLLQFCFLGDRNIRALQVMCNYDENGCSWVGEVADADRHIDKCQYRMIVCPNMCKDTKGKERMVLQIDMQKHLENECQRRLHSCPHCKEVGEHYIIVSPTHLNICKHLKIPCPNESCREKVKRMNLSKHKYTCPFETISCKYEVVGCKTVMKRQEMERHEKSEGTTNTHLSFAMDAVLEQQRLIKNLEGQLARITSANEGKFNFKMSSFEHHKASTSLFFSPAFYTSRGGYKMCIRVVANGDGQGKDTNISVYAVVMKGDYDDNLKWPITGTVTVELLNQLEDTNHHAIRFTYPEGRGDVSTQRVTAGERAKRGYGKTRFIPYTQLGYDKAGKCQYLKDDCLYFHVQVEIPSLKPWLACSI